MRLAILQLICVHEPTHCMPQPVPVPTPIPSLAALQNVILDPLQGLRLDMSQSHYS
jgi:hypothetical protein